MGIMRGQKYVITAALITVTLFVTTEWVWNTNPLQYRKFHEQFVPETTTKTIAPVVRQSVTLNDGSFDYHLNLSSFEAEFPHLQSYECSTVHTPREEPPGTQPLVILAIKSHPGSGDRRAALRQTWAREQELQGYRLRPIFLLAMTESSGQLAIVEVESKEYGDILLWDFAEGHHNLSLKERCFLEWLHHHIPNVAFIFKGDDDEFVNPDAVVRYVSVHGSPYTVHGWHDHRPPVMRSTKYRISHRLYPQERYPGFVSGGGFLFPGPSVKRLVEASRILPVFPLDDVYFGFLILAANLTYRHDNRFYVRGLWYEACKYKEAIVVHGIDPERLIHIWNNISRSNC